MNMRDEACNSIKEGRKIAWYRLRDQGIEIDAMNINKANDVLVQKDRKRLNEDVLAGFASSAPAISGGKDKKAAPAKDAKGGAKGGVVLEE